ncbi:MAG TPA: hypothetical protein VE890_11985 [Thermoguttaceae bacterium]|nr:hypothetical protein [Thermoguttaceae bacterium]
MNGDDSQQAQEPKRRPPLQFSLQSLFWITVAVSLLFGTLEAFDVPTKVSAMVLVILIVSVLTALGLVVAIDRATDDDR